MDHNENSKDAVSCGALTKSLSGYYAKIFLDKEHTALARASLSGKICGYLNLKCETSAGWTHSLTITPRMKPVKSYGFSGKQPVADSEAALHHYMKALEKF